MAFTKEEIESGHISIFDHIKNPEDKVSLATIMRLLDIIPLVERNLIDMLIDKLIENGYFKQIIKQKLNGVSKQLDSVIKDVIKNMNRSGDKSIEATESWNDGYYDFVDKFSSGLLMYINRLETLTNVSHFLTEKKRNDDIISQAKFLFQLNEGDTFIFLDMPSAVEYTFSRFEWANDDEGYRAYFKKLNNKGTTDTVEFYEDKFLRPVICTNIISNEDEKELITKVITNYDKR